MKKIDQLFDQYRRDITEIENSIQHDRISLNKSISLSKKCLDNFNKEVRAKIFDTTKEEIIFFKQQKPFVEGRLLYFIKVKDYLLTQPISSYSKQIKLANYHLKNLESQKSNHTEFAKYYKLEETKLDHIYFLRVNDKLEVFDCNIDHYKDSKFSTSHDFLVSKIIARDLLIKFYSNEVKSLKKKKANKSIQKIDTPTPILPDLNWTGTKAELALITYILKKGGYINNGNVEISKIADAFSLIFNIELKHIYKIFEKMKSNGFDSSNFNYTLNEILNKLFKPD